MMRRKMNRLTAYAAASAVLCGAMSAMPAASVSAAADVLPYVIEGENLEGADLWTSIYQDEIPGYSGEGFAYLTANALSFSVNVPEDGMYSITVHGAQILNEEGRYQTVEVNGAEYHTTVPYTREWMDFDFGMVRLDKGENTISFVAKYGYMAIDYVTVADGVFPDLTKATAVPCDQKATAEACALMAYLQSVYGTNILSGQQQIYGGGNSMSTTIRYDSATNTCVDADGKTYTFNEADKDTADDGSTFVWTCYDENGQDYHYNTQNRNYTYNYYNNDVDLIYAITGKYPAIQGFDFGSYCPCYAWDDGVVGRMIDWTNNKGGICTASWHVNVPTVMADYTLGEPLDFSKTTYSEKTNFVTANCLVEGTVEYDYFRLCMENLAAELLKLQAANVPVIFRPFHEAEGNGGADGKGAWFWWAKEGAEVYKQLWAYLQDTLENEYGLHNLIWEQNLYAWSDDSALWYSGDDRVDIVAFDKYNTQYNRHDGKTSGPNLDAETGIFYKLVGYVKGNKMVAMAENDSVPSLTNMTVEHAFWLYFCPWYDSEQARFVTGENYQDMDALKELYNSSFCITLDELPEDLFTNSTPIVTTSTTEPDSELKLGDTDCNGSVELKDAVLLAKGNAGIMQISVQGTRNADLDRNGKVENNDLIVLLKVLAGSIDLRTLAQA